MKYYILVNADGKEKVASMLSFRDVKDVMKEIVDIKVIKLNAKKWQHQIKKIKARSLCFLLTHGGFGENGSLQQSLKNRDIFYTHSDATVCGILSNKHLTKLVYLSLGIKTSCWKFDGQVYACKKKEKLTCSLVYKPLFGGSKMGIKILENTLQKGGENNIFEKFIDGELEISVCVLNAGKNIKVLSPVIRKRKIFASSVIKGKNGNEGFELEVEKNILDTCKSYAKRIHSSLRCNGVTKTDFLLDKKGNVWAIETDAIPGLAKNNATAIAAKKSGIGYKNLIKYIMNDAYEK